MHGCAKLLTYEFVLSLIYVIIRLLVYHSLHLFVVLWFCRFMHVWAYGLRTFFCSFVLSFLRAPPSLCHSPSISLLLDAASHCDSVLHVVFKTGFGGGLFGGGPTPS